MRKTFEQVQAEQLDKDVEIVRDFFSRVPQDTVLGLLGEELIESLRAGGAVRAVS